MRKRSLKYLILISLLLLSIPTAAHFTVKADTADTANLRIMATSDLHGQVTAYDYETNLALPKNGLSKIATLVEQNRKEVGANNTLLVDDGDFLYDYTTNYFYDNYRGYVQPILKAMEIMGYDYITLGNHEFDYPWNYLKNQLVDSNMSDKVLVCNTVWHDNGKLVFAPSSMITKYLTTAAGKVVKVKVGIIGSTTNSISTRRGDYVNEIDALNNYDSIVAEANRLKQEENADIVIVLLHGGIGSDKTYGASDNIGYALTKVNSIDAVITGHTHEIFPNTNSTGIGLKNVDNTNGLINGKPVIATSSHAKALGLIDLSLVIAADGTVKITSGKSSIDYVTADIAENSRITAMFSNYMDKLKAGADTATYPVASGVSYHNYDTVVRDCNLYQLFNNAKIAYGLAYVAEYLPAYKGVPVIACTRNLLDSNEPTVYLKDTLSSSKISRILSEASASRPSGYTQLYEISGKALREWLEYNASIYATEGTNFTYILQGYVSSNQNVSTLLQENNVYNWNTQYVFDGISYKIDLTKKARYSSDGIMLNPNNKRITSLTYNAAPVTDSQKFVLVADSGLPLLSFLPAEMEDSIKPVIDNATGKKITLDYISRLSSFGKISVKADDNWGLTASSKYTFLLGVSKKIVSTVSTYPWSQGIATETTSYSFLKGTLPVTAQKINLVVTQGRAEVNNEAVPVIISATSKYAIKSIKYLSGTITTVTDSKWVNAAVVSNNKFTTMKNGIYTILATDANNKSALTYIKVDRYNADILASPKPDRLTNRNSTFTGKSIPDATIYATIGDDKYTTKVKSDGSFSITVKPPKAFATINVHAEYNGIKSAIVTAAVRKTGPDAVQINPIKVGATHITGTADPDTLVYTLIWTTVYVGKGQTQAYIASDFYNPKYKIAETDSTVDKNTGEYDILVPATKLNMKVFVFAYDRLGATSKSSMQMTTY
ncbi:MAG TPA: metallophosphoesterase [Mobilitalea sp.]|nr:metallophosphoesterase [Mobilitalea sp.]